MVNKRRAEVAAVFLIAATSVLSSCSSSHQSKENVDSSVKSATTESTPSSPLLMESSSSISPWNEERLKLNPKPPPLKPGESWPVLVTEGPKDSPNPKALTLVDNRQPREEERRWLIQPTMPSKGSPLTPIKDYLYQEYFPPSLYFSRVTTDESTVECENWLKEAPLLPKSFYRLKCSTSLPQFVGKDLEAVKNASGGVAPSMDGYLGMTYYGSEESLVRTRAPEGGVLSRKEVVGAALHESAHIFLREHYSAQAVLAERFFPKEDGKNAVNAFWAREEATPYSEKFEEAFAQALLRCERPTYYYRSSIRDEIVSCPLVREVLEAPYSTTHWSKTVKAMDVAHRGLTQ